MELQNLPGLFNGNKKESPQEILLSETRHAVCLAQGLNDQRKAGVLCDVILQVEGTQFPCHRNVLAASSPYFMAMFTSPMKEAQQETISICGLEADVMGLLIEYAYTSNISISANNAQHLLSGANLLQMVSVREACCSFLERQMDAANCLGILCFAEAHLCQDLAKWAKKYTEENFVEVSSNDEILLLPVAKVIEIISSPTLGVEHEEHVFEAALRWVHHDLEHREALLPQVLEHVRLPLLSPYTLIDRVEIEPVLQTPAVRPFIEEAKQYFILKDRRTQMTSPRTQPRLAMPLSETIVIVGGEIYSKSYLNCCDSYDVTNNTWWKIKDLPFSRCHHAACVAEDLFLYVSGGFNKERVVLSNVVRYESTLDRWIRVAPMTTARARHAMAAVDGHVYVVGGFDGNARLDTVEQYCAATNTWSCVAPMTMPVSRISACALNGALYTAGGVGDPGNQCVDLVQRYSPKTNSWEMLAPLLQPRVIGGLVAVRGQLWAVGGTLESLSPCLALTCFSPEKNRWREMEPMPTKRFDSAVSATGDKIYMLSGHDGENSFLNTLEEYDTQTGRWSQLRSTTLPFGRCRFTAAVLKIPKRL